MRAARRRSSACLAIAVIAAACASVPPNPERYRLAHSGSYWDVVHDDRVLLDLQPRYPEYFAVILDPALTRLPNLLALRDDLERRDVDRRNFDALNSLAIGYFEMNYRAESQRGQGLSYLSTSQRAAQLLAVPWRGYAETDDAALRDAILDFFDDAANGEKLGSRATAGRIGPVVSSLARKEEDALRRERIAAIVATLEARVASEDEQVD